MKILVVEDEMLVAMLIEDLVQDLGHRTVGPAMRLETALELADTADIDCAILDINLAGKQSFPVAHRLLARKIPFIFASGYGAAGLCEPFLSAPVLQKPFDAKALAAILDRIVG
jgi:DNA-binding response OmpR family regulator